MTNKPSFAKAFTLAAGLSLLSLQALAGADAALYGPSAPKGSTFVRLYNASSSPAAASVGNTQIKPVGAQASSDFSFLPGGDYTAQVGGKSVPVKLAADKYYTLVNNAGGSPQLIEEPPFKNKQKALVRVQNLSEANGQPVSLMTAWYPGERFAGLLQMLQEGTGTSEMLRRLGVQDYVRAESRVTTQMPTEETAHLLKQPPTRPLLCVASVDVDLAGRRIKYGETLFCGDRVQLTVTMGDTQ